MMKETDRRKEFYKIALKIIKEKGFKAMTMRDIATEMECDVSNIYNFVKSKEAILDHLLFEISDKFHVGMTAIESSNYSALDKLKAVVSLHIRLTFENPNQVLLLTNEWKLLKPDAQKRFLDFRNDYENRLKNILKEGRNQNIFRIEDIDFTTNCILSAIRWQ